ncbi:MAG: von Willebrand factor type A domain-containing protein [Thermoflexibacter sp.]|nr:von Willebrand factor type A domain-containing protein [Thermoflexibacter sp.]
MKQLSLFFMALLFALSALAQSRTITGTVRDKDSNGELPGVSVVVKGTTTGTTTDFSGKYQITANSDKDILIFSFVGYITQEVKVEQRQVIDVVLEPDARRLEEVVVIGYGVQNTHTITGSISKVIGKKQKKSKPIGNYVIKKQKKNDLPNDESYEKVEENKFQTPRKEPLSTFSIDVDVASYSNLRRMLNEGQKPPADAVRIEEMINYFSYNYKQPDNQHPFSINTELSTCPWNEKHKLVLIGLQGKNVALDNLPPNNLVFLIDVSGSMSDANKLPLLKSSFRLLVKQLRPQDKVAIVVYAGAAGLVLSATSGENKDRIIDALDNLQAGGSTAGGAGIQLAYKVAKENFIEKGNNRVILATDGDFNVGASSDNDMEQLITEQRESGIYITCLGFGMGNYKDSKMERIADKGNGNYAYIDNLQEANKVLVKQLGGTLLTIAKDVKIQIEFNPARVQAYRLIGYENRILDAEDFTDDKKDAGELGAGHSVTALYEIIPVGVESSFLKEISDLKYQKLQLSEAANTTEEMLTVKFRYKPPQSSKSTEIVDNVLDKSINLENTSESFRFASAVALFGMLLKNSAYKAQGNYEMVSRLAKNAKSKDEDGYRAEFVRLVETLE